MGFIAIILVVSFVLACISVLKPRTKTKFPLPPGPRPFPIIGNLLELGSKPHQSLANLSKTYGPLMTLKLGRLTTIVISSPNVVKQVLENHDHLFNNRLTPDAIKALNHDKYSIVWLPVAPKWRNLRKIFAIQLLTKQRLDASQSLRAQKVKELLDYVQQSCKSGQAVSIAETASTTSLNLISSTLFSSDLAGYGSNLSHDFKKCVWSALEQTGKFNISDFVPMLRSLDLQGKRKKLKFHLEKLIGIFEGIINDRLKLRSSSTTSLENNDVLDALLKLIEENEYEFSINDLTHLLIDLFVGATDTTSSTLEWAMAELINNPTVMAKAKAELKEVLGNKAFQESDAANLPYLQAIIKEALRMHPAIVFLFHIAEIDVEINGYTLPKGAQVQVNLWAIFRDPNIWSSPDSFMPERFLEHKTESKSRDFEFMPFGIGRRICPGVPLVDRMVPLMLASLLQNFDWKLENDQKPEDMDMEEKFGITVQKAEPLRAVPIKVFN